MSSIRARTGRHVFLLNIQQAMPYSGASRVFIGVNLHPFDTPRAIHLNVATIVRNVSRCTLMRFAEHKQRQRLRKERARFATSDVNRVLLYLIGEQQRSEDYTDGSPRWLHEVGGETLSTRSRGAGSRAEGGHRSRDSALAESRHEQSRACARLQVAARYFISAC